MKADRSTRAPFADLPLEGQFLFFMTSIMAMACLRPWPPTREEVGADLEQIWNSENLTYQDLRDFSRMVELLKVRLGHSCSHQDRIQDPRKVTTRF